VPFVFEKVTLLKLIPPAVIVWATVPLNVTMLVETVYAVTPLQLPPTLIAAAPLQVRVPTVKLPVTPRVPVEIVIVPLLLMVAAESVLAAIASVPADIVKVPPTLSVPAAGVFVLAPESVRLLYAVKKEILMAWADPEVYSTVPVPAVNVPPPAFKVTVVPIFKVPPFVIVIAPLLVLVPPMVSVVPIVSTEVLAENDSVAVLPLTVPIVRVEHAALVISTVTVAVPTMVTVSIELGTTPRAHVVVVFQLPPVAVLDLAVSVKAVSAANPEDCPVAVRTNDTPR